MKRVLKQAAWLLRQPSTSMVVGIMLVLTGLGEVVSTVFEEIDGVNLKSEHGLILFGLFQVSRALLDIADGVERVETGDVNEASAGV
ncbi:MAG: hypothetical protein ACFB6R_07795 [Alphaproteobacteria bacterium]